MKLKDVREIIEIHRNCNNIGTKIELKFPMVDLFSFDTNSFYSMLDNNEIDKS